VTVCQTPSEVRSLLKNQPRRVTLVSTNRGSTEQLLGGFADFGHQFRRAFLLTLAPPRAESIPALQLFKSVFGLIEGIRWLPLPELLAVVAREDASDRFVAGCVDSKAKSLTLLRGDLQLVVAPLSMFKPSGDGTKPEFGKLRIADHGRTIGFGDYEASADAILYELDPVYRRRLKALRQKSERSFGAALRRLRKQRGLGRGDFAPLSSKEIARIERDEVKRPHAATLQLIADRLGVRPADIKDY
jgi:hypothetical protein